ncbi:twitching motility protein PilT [Ignicoccus islandicus DSM 13165]|uniref:Twitching motility protein PilT n=2 Tax=Ignicoccus islandicus TaxID=54259 RepID=A0A0U3F763_9CREN|nr:twitching motility protein PilT [Ignicoccus islandicus DSM 13165]
MLRDYQDPDELVKAIEFYRLAPNDAQIVLTCKHSNIESLATFDEDFKRIPWLKIIGTERL